MGHAICLFFAFLAFVGVLSSCRQPCASLCSILHDLLLDETSIDRGGTGIGLALAGKH